MIMGRRREMSAGAAILLTMSHESLPVSSRFGGIVTARELAEAGVSRAQLRSLVRQRVLLPIGRSVYARAALAAEVTSCAGEQALQVAAALAVAGPGVVASHHAAAGIHGLDLLDRPPAGTAITRPPGATGSRTGRPGVRVHAAALPASHVTAWHAIPVTTVARTVVDLARTSSFRAGVVVADSALRKKQTSKAELQSVVTDCRRWRDIQRARQVVAFSDARSESAFESISRVAFRDHGLPPPDLQAWVGDEEMAIGRVDFLWSAQRTIGEADGMIKYANRYQALAQLQRDARLREAGFEVVHFTWEEIVRVPGQVAAAIRAAFQRAAG